MMLRGRDRLSSGGVLMDGTIVASPSLAVGHSLWLKVEVAHSKIEATLYEPLLQYTVRVVTSAWSETGARTPSKLEIDDRGPFLASSSSVLKLKVHCSNAMTHGQWQTVRRPDSLYG